MIYAPQSGKKVTFQTEVNFLGKSEATCWVCNSGKTPKFPSLCGGKQHQPKQMQEKSLESQSTATLE